MTGQDDTSTLTLQKKAEAFCILNKVVHISYINGHWARGTIKYVGADFFQLIERLEGEIPVFFSEIKDIRVFVEKEKEVGDIFK